MGTMVEPRLSPFSVFVTCCSSFRTAWFNNNVNFGRQGGLTLAPIALLFHPVRDFLGPSYCKFHGYHRHWHGAFFWERLAVQRHVRGKTSGRVHRISRLEAPFGALHESCRRHRDPFTTNWARTPDHREIEEIGWTIINMRFISWRRQSRFVTENISQYRFPSVTIGPRPFYQFTSIWLILPQRTFCWASLPTQPHLVFFQTWRAKHCKGHGPRLARKL